MDKIVTGYLYSVGATAGFATWYYGAEIFFYLIDRLVF